MPDEIDPSSGLPSASAATGLWTAITWDGCLPLLAAGSRVLLPLVIAVRDIADMVAMIVIPIVAALARGATVAVGNWKCSVVVPASRQVLFSAAIAVMLLFDGLCGLLLCGRGVPVELWLLATAMYVVYLGLVTIALHPPE